MAYAHSTEQQAQRRQRCNLHHHPRKPRAGTHPVRAGTQVQGTGLQYRASKQVHVTGASPVNCTASSRASPIACLTDQRFQHRNATMWYPV